MLSTGEIPTLNKYLEKTPLGILEILQIKGLGAKKIKLLWNELGIESPGELLYACTENRLVELKGFGTKSQEDVKRKLHYYFDSKGKYHFASIIETAQNLLSSLKVIFPDSEISHVGEIRRKLPIVQSIEILIGTDMENAEEISIKELENLIIEDGSLSFMSYPVLLYHCEHEEFSAKLFELSGSKEFVSKFDIDPEAESEEEIFDEGGLPFMEPELRDGDYFYFMAMDGYKPELLEMSDIKGVIHNHSTYSDGMNTLKEMADYVQTSGFQYFVISDHSKSAFYANGLREERIFMQWKEIDELNSLKSDFKIYKSIESDILNDGSLDYDDDILRGF